MYAINHTSLRSSVLCVLSIARRVTAVIFVCNLFSYILLWLPMTVSAQVLN